MAGIKRALRRRFVWTLVAAVLGAAILTGCNGKDKQPNDDAVLSELSQPAGTWLGGIGRSAATLDCPPSDTVVKPTGFDGSDSSEVEACLIRDAGGGLVVRVHNRTGVPVTVWPATRLGVPTTLQLSQTVQPNATVDVPVHDPHWNDVLKFEPQLQLGVTTAIIGSLTGMARPYQEWTDCAYHPDARCVIGRAVSLLGDDAVKIGRWTVPVKQIAELLTNLWDHAPLLRSFWDRATGPAGGRLTLVRASDA
jgi:hypothetical protein